MSPSTSDASRRPGAADPRGPVNVICMKWGGKYGSEYVNILRRMVKRRLGLAHRFVCFTDDDRNFDTDIEAHPLPFADMNEGREFGWNKLTVFADGLAELSGPTLFLDLDVVIVEALDPLFTHRPGKFLIIDDWDFPGKLIGNSSVFRFDKNADYARVLTDFQENAGAVRRRYRNEQAYLSAKINEMGLLDYWPRPWCRSFKRHCLPAFPLNLFKAAALPEGVKIVIFHGKPHPPLALRGGWAKHRYIRAVPWMKDHWR